MPVKIALLKSVLLMIFISFGIHAYSNEIIDEFPYEFQEKLENFSEVVYYGTYRDKDGSKKLKVMYKDFNGKIKRAIFDKHTKRIVQKNTKKRKTQIIIERLSDVLKYLNNENAVNVTIALRVESDHTLGYKPSVSTIEFNDGNVVQHTLNNVMATKKELGSSKHSIG